MGNHELKVRTATEEDAIFIGNNLRDIDVYECWAVSHLGAVESVKLGFERAMFCKCIVVDDIPVCIYGVTPTKKEEYGIVWLLITEEATKAKELFLKKSKPYMDELFEHKKILFNYVYSKNKMSIKWIKALGFQVEKPVPYGMEQDLFCLFFKAKDKEVIHV